jgi:anti-sigma regulatory factor (Ser/Thr protein kinase)
VVTIDLPPEPRSASRAREMVRQHLAPVAPADAIETAALLTTELVTNAVLHAQTTISLLIEIESGRIILRVGDGSETVPARRNYASDAATGRGLALVDQLATAWGVEPSARGKEVWVEIEFAAVSADGSEQQEAAT